MKIQFLLYFFGIASQMHIISVDANPVITTLSSYEQSIKMAYEKMQADNTWDQIPMEDKRIIYSAINKTSHAPIPYIKVVLSIYLITKIKDEEFNQQAIESYHEQAFKLPNNITYQALKNMLTHTSSTLQ